MKIVTGILKSKIETDNPELLRVLSKLYTYKVPGYEFTSAYKSRHWDGNKRFIGPSGSFRTGLLSSILKELEKINCTPDIERTYPTPPKPTTALVEGFTYYDFQEELIEKALSEHRGIVKSPTGSGKTLIMAGIVKSLKDKKIVILFNAKQLLTQTYEFLKSCGISNLGLCFGEGYIYGDIMLCTVQSIDKILDTHLESAEVLLVDEAHEFANGKMTLAAINSFPKATYRIGFTATPPSDDIPKLNLEGAFGPTWEVASTSSLVEEGKLTKPIIQLLRTATTSGLDEDMAYNEVYETFIVQNSQRNQTIVDIVENIKQSNSKARIMILTKNLNHVNILQDLIEGAHRLWGDDNISTRYSVISKFLNSKTSTVLIGTKILQTGINIEEITHLINARGLKSEIATIQALGRALRKHESKSEVYIYDFMDNARYLSAHSKRRKSYYISEGHEVKVI